MSNKVLLTGAGFSTNFGAPLASEMATLIFNEPIIQQNKNLRSLLHNNFDYESIYNEVISGGSDEEKEVLTEAIKKSYKHLDERIICYHDLTQTYKDLFEDFLFKFSNNRDGSGFFFTLNQDLLIERRIEAYTGHPTFELPVMGSSVLGKQWKDSLTEQDFRVIPVEFQKEKEKYSQSRIDISYIKLHGSQEWYTAENKNIIILGRNKMKDINSSLLLNWYFDIFQEQLNKTDTKLMIIGYGFNDSHINEALVNAAVNLKIYIINPSSIQIFMEELTKKSHGPRIKNLIHGYYQRTLVELFPNDPEVMKRHPDLEKINSHFFNDAGSKI